MKYLKDRLDYNDILEERESFLKVIDGDVRLYYDDGNPGKVYYTKGDAKWAKWLDDEKRDYLLIQIEDGRTAIVTTSGQIKRYI